MWSARSEHLGEWCQEAANGCVHRLRPVLVHQMRRRRNSDPVDRGQQLDEPSGQRGHDFRAVLRRDQKGGHRQTANLRRGQRWNCPPDAPVRPRLHPGIRRGHRRVGSPGRPDQVRCPRSVERNVGCRRCTGTRRTAGELVRPGAQIADPYVDEDDRLPRTTLPVGQLRAVDLNRLEVLEPTRHRHAGNSAALGRPHGTFASRKRSRGRLNRTTGTPCTRPPRLPESAHAVAPGSDQHRPAAGTSR